TYAVDFGSRPRSLVFGAHPGANYLAHVAGGSLLRVLRGDAGAELFHACGDLRLYEKILGVRDGTFWAPPEQGWALYDRLPEPLTWYLRHPGRWALEPAAPAPPARPFASGSSPTLFEGAAAHLGALARACAFSPPDTGEAVRLLAVLSDSWGE